MTYKNELAICACCNTKICKKCRIKSTQPIPVEHWSNDVTKSVDMMGYMCIDCYPKCVMTWMIMLIDKYSNLYSSQMDKYLVSKELQNPEKPKPSEDTRNQKALRVGLMVGNVVSALGYDSYVKAIKVAAVGGSALNLLLDPATIKMLDPLMTSLKEHNLTSTSDMLSIYYLGKLCVCISIYTIFIGIIIIINSTYCVRMQL